MVGPRDLSLAELQRCGLGLIQRRASSAEPVIRAYCLRCGSQVAADRRDVDPERWWVCGRGCNTRYVPSAPHPTDPPAPTTRDGIPRSSGSR